MHVENNPFEYAAANTLSPDLLIKYYIDDFNYSRFVQSKRNVFLIGDRGSGKTMTLLYHSWKVQRRLFESTNQELSLATIGIYIPCNTPLMYKPEHELLEDFKSAVISEHFLGLYMAHCFVNTLSQIPGVLDGVEEETLRSEAELLIGVKLPETLSFLKGITACLHRELRNTQRALNSVEATAFYSDTFSFASVFYPLVTLCRSNIPRIRESHFLLLIDDAQVLNQQQSRAINSWIAYRDHSFFSFKVAIPEIDSHPKRTAVGSSILESHDYIRVDLQGPDYRKDSGFYHLARKLMHRRLINANIHVPIEEFFPLSEAMKVGLDKAEELVRREAYSKYGESDTKAKARQDYIYKYRRARYFQHRHFKANLPPYSGFDLLVFLSTGVIRNLLEPCFWMFDRTLSERGLGESEFDQISGIPSNIQSEIIIDLSKRKWQWLQYELAQDIDGCTSEVGDQAYRLMNSMATYFRYRLLHHKSEPRALAFTISGRHDSFMAMLTPVLRALRKAQLLYIREGPSKDRGERETYYVPNRILWPVRGLDPQGQHARASIAASELVRWMQGSDVLDIDSGDDGQRKLWEDE